MGFSTRAALRARLYIQIIIFAFPPRLVLKYASDTAKASPSVPVDGKLGKRGLQLIRRVLGGPRNGGGDLDLPAVAGGRPKRPGDFPQGRLAAVPVEVVHPQRRAGPVVAALDGDGDGAGGVADLVAAGGVGDAPVGVVVGADGGQAGRVVEELDARLDPFPVGAVGELEEDAGLVELVGVCGEEGDACGFEAEGWALGMDAIGGCGELEFVFI